MDRNGEAAIHRVRRIWMAPVLYLVVFSFVVGSAARAEAPARGTLSGTVLGPDGAPVEGVRVWVNAADQSAMAETRTDGAGRFRLGPLGPVYRSPFDLLVDAPGFARQYVARGSYSIYPGVDVDLGVIQVERGGVFTGRVLDADGTPRPNAPVNCGLARNVLGGRISWDGPALIRLTTDATGVFRTPPLPVADCFLFVQVPGRREAGWRGAVAPGVESALETIRLERETPVPGVVRDEQGRPIAGVELRVNSRYVETSDAAGRFTIHGQGPDLYAFLDGSRDGYVNVAWHVEATDAGFRWNDVRGGDRSGFQAGKDLVVVMKKTAGIKGWQAAAVPARQLTGRVTCLGRPVAVGWAALWSGSGLTGLLRGRTVVEAPQVYSQAPIRDGAYTLDVPSASNDWYVVVEEPGRPPTQIGPVSIGDEAGKTLDIACIEGGGIRGRVVDVPAGWAGHLWVVAFTETSLRAEAKIDADGRFSLERLASGEYGLKVGHDAFDDADAPRGFPTPPLWTADPWTRARMVTVQPGRETEGVELRLPE